MSWPSAFSNWDQKPRWEKVLLGASAALFNIGLIILIIFLVISVAGCGEEVMEDEYRTRQLAWLSQPIHPQNPYDEHEFFVVVGQERQPGQNFSRVFLKKEGAPGMMTALVIPHRTLPIGARVQYDYFDFHSSTGGGSFRFSVVQPKFLLK